MIQKLVLIILIFNSTLLFGETLEKVLIDTFNYFPDIKKSKSELNIAKKNLTISKTDFLPSIDLSMSQGRKVSKSNPDTSSYNFTNTNPSTLDVDISQPLGATKYLNLKSSRNDLDIAKLKNEALIQDVLYRATKGYYSYLKERFLLDVAIKNENNLTQKFEATEKRFNFRDVTKTDVFQAKARLAEATAKRIEAENNVEIAESEFNAVVGRKPDINWFPDNKEKITGSNPKDWQKFATLPKLPLSLDQALEIALENNHQLKQLFYELENSKISIKQSGLNFLPEFSVTATYGKSLETSRTVDRRNDYEVTADMSIPLFNKGHNFINLNKSKDTALSSHQAFESKKLNLTHEVKSAWKRIKSSKSSIESLEISVESNLVALEGVSKEAGVGSRTTLNILDAEKELTQAEASLVNAQFSLIDSSYQLLKSCGLLNFSYLDINF